MTGENDFDTVLNTCVACGDQRFDTPARCPGFCRCGTCGLLCRDAPARERLAASFYQDQQVVSVEADWVAGRRRVFAAEIHRLACFRQTGRLLDVGAGHGFFLSACQDEGWEPTGIEIGRRAAAYARSQFGLEILETPIEAAALSDNAFDVVTFWNVLDQLPDPRSALLHAVRALRPGGGLVVRCPNASFHLRVRQLARGLAVLIPALRRLDDLTVFHLFSFPPTALRCLLEAVGLQSVEIEAAPLAWTQGTDDPVSPAKRLLRQSIHGSAALLQSMSGGRLQLCPSMVARAVKCTAPAAVDNGHGSV